MSRKVKITDKNSFGKNSTLLLKDWDFKKNTIDPYKVTIKSNFKVYWICYTCSHEWETTICQRSSGSGCPKCNKGGCYVLNRKNNILSKKFPSLLKEWHPTKNSISPDNITCNSQRFVWWQCSSCNYEWEYRMIGRTKFNRGCLKCSSLAVVKPQISILWHPTKNNTLTPYDVKPESIKKV